MLLDGLAIELDGEPGGEDDLDGYEEDIASDIEPPRAEVGRRFTLTTEEVID